MNYFKLILIFLFFVLVWILSPFFISKVLKELYLITNLEVGEQFGDSFGAINSLFSGLAFAGLIIAIYLQKLELEQTRNEVSRTLQVQEEQVQTMKLTATINSLAIIINSYDQLLIRYKGAQGGSAQKARVYEEKKNELISVLGDKLKENGVDVELIVD